MKKILVVLLGIMFFVSCHKSNKTKHSLIDLKCEYSANPIGIDTDVPRFSWRLHAASDIKKQWNYRLVVGTDSSKIAENKSLVWDSGKIKSDVNLLGYHGEKLLPNTKYFWAVKVWDNNGNESSLSEIGLPHDIRH